MAPTESDIQPADAGEPDVTAVAHSESANDTTNPSSLVSDGSPDTSAQPAASSEEENPSGKKPSRLISLVTSSQTSGFVTSMLTHVVLLLILACLTLPILPDHELLTVFSAITEKLEEELEEVEMPLQEFTTSESTEVMVDNPTPMSDASAPSTAFAASTEALAIVEAPSEMQLKPTIGDIDIGQLSAALPSGFVGQGRVVVDNYDQAFDKLAQEILGMLEESKVLVIWVFDQSGSMKDDQQVIRDRLEQVYAELGLREITGGGNLMTAVTSYGKEFAVHTPRPTDNLEKIKSAIDEIPVDLSGEEMMCRAVGQSIQHHADFVRRGQRRTALVLVTDESGNRADNNGYLEQVIQMATSSETRIYSLGREAVFGCPFAHIRWEHPQTFVIHYIPIDRGPESAYVEQLQTEGFRRRYDSHPSGYGPYEQSRMARETGAIFFLLPSVELDVVELDKRRYRLDLMREYRPDLRRRDVAMAEIAESPLRTGLTKIIYDMNPYNEQAAKVIVMRDRFSKNIKEFIQQVNTEQTKITIYMDYLDRMGTALEQFWGLRKQETIPRWQANADLIRAQLLAYKIRLYEYKAYLQYFMTHPQVVPLTKSPNLHLIDWRITRRQEMLTGEVTAQYLAQAKEHFQTVIDKHPDTPWAARAEKEMESGFGVHLYPYYRRIPTGTGTSPLIPVPKL
ncbi:MAG: VWA domain-containing protein [Pirellulales bacterium]|nr:VWA domain-containing protein [Pirellulales bacterium]